MQTNIESRYLRVCTLIFVLGIVSGWSTSAMAAVDDLVLVIGQSTSDEYMTVWQEDGEGRRSGRRAERDSEDICRGLLEASMSILYPNHGPEMVDQASDLYDEPVLSVLWALMESDAVRFDRQMEDEGREDWTPEQREQQRALASIYQRIERTCNDYDLSDGYYTAVLTSCALLMRQGPYLLHWTVSPDGSSSIMSINDPTSGKRYTFDWKKQLQEVPRSGKGYTYPGMPSVVPTGGRREMELFVEVGTPGKSSGSFHAITGKLVHHAYEGPMYLEVGGGVAMKFAKMKSKGHAYVTKDIPGFEVFRKYYESLDRTFSQAAGNSTLFSAMSRQLAKITQYGMPIEFNSDIEVSVVAMGIPMGVGRGAEDSTTMEAIAVWPGGAAEVGLCNHPPRPPEGYEEVNMDEMMANAGMTGDDERGRGSGRTREELPSSFRDVLSEMFTGRSRRGNDEEQDEAEEEEAEQENPPL